jgi:succinoglycan biosynthesis protein ExoA|uniref:glycosyltransferase family 2 protein n=1 Tax=Aquiluna sp. TaxID=2053504 RepID=UPI004047D201
MADLKDVSFVMPVLNEQDYLAIAVESVLSQKTPGKAQLVLALGPSRDKTNQIAESLAKKYKNLILVENPTGSTATGLNLAIEKSSYETVIRVDAHSELSDNYAASAVKILNTTGAANVGGMMIAKGRTAFQRAVAFGYNSRFGLGGGSFHVGGNPGPADTVYLGCFRKSIITELGLYEAKWVRGQDWELNLRIRQAGHTVWFDPGLKVGYYPRESIKALGKQFYSTGVWRGSLTKQSPMESSFRYWIPPLLVLASVLQVPLWIYLFAVTLVSFGVSKLDLSSKFWLLAVLPTMHFCWGIGFWVGLLSNQTKAR